MRCHGFGNVGEAPASEPRAGIEVDVLVEGEIPLVISSQLGEQLASQEADRAADAEDLTRVRVRRAVGLAFADLVRARRRCQRLSGTVV